MLKFFIIVFSVVSLITPVYSDNINVFEFTKSELEEGRKQWGIQYNDECLKFEKEWEILAQAVEDKQNAFID